MKSSRFVDVYGLRSLLALRSNSIRTSLQEPEGMMGDMSGYG